MKEVEKIIGFWLRLKCVRKVVNDCLEVLRENIILYGEDFGKVLGYGLFYFGEENEEFVWEMIFFVIIIVVEK